MKEDARDGLFLLLAAFGVMQDTPYVVCSSSHRIVRIFGLPGVTRLSITQMTTEERPLSHGNEMVSDKERRVGMLRFPLFCRYSSTALVIVENWERSDRRR
jgi:hypothetical protein